MSTLWPSDVKGQCLCGYTVALTLLGVGAALVWPASWPCILALVSGGALAGWGTAWWLKRQLRRRVHELRAAAEAVERGEDAEALARCRRDDFVKLAESLERVSRQLRELSEEQERLRRRLTQSEKLALIGELAAIVAHEVNNPLDGLQNAVRLLRHAPLGQAQTDELLGLMEGGLSRIEMSVRRLLLMSRDEPLNLQPADLETVIDEAVAFVRPRLDRQGIQMVRERDPGALTALIDRTQMVPVLINLMCNAADAMPEGGRLILRSLPAPGTGECILDVSDTGTGIPPEQLPHIFEPFFTTKPRGKGTGLGLAVVARVIEAHGGRIEVTSTPGAGTRFRLRLRAADPAVCRPVAAGTLNQPEAVGS